MSDAPAAAWQRDRPVAFLHIPKAAGTSVRRALEEALAPARSVEGLCREHFGDFRGFDAMAPDVRARVFATPDEIPRGADLVSGHISDGFLRHAYPTAQFVTLLREPRARLVSLWAFCRTLSDEYLAPWGGWADRIRAARRPLGRFVGDPALAAITDNVAVRMLLSPHPLIRPDRPIAPAADATLLDAATARLDRYAFVDLSDNPDGAANLGAWLGRSIALARLNETPPMPEALRTSLDGELDSETLAVMAERGRLDAALWCAVARRRRADKPVAALADDAFAETVRRHAARDRAGRQPR